MNCMDFLSELHTSTKRDYVARVNGADKAECAAVAKRYDYDFWDGERKYGYGGYKYDGRWKSVAQKLIDHYGLKAGQSVLDVGCGKAHLLYEIKQLVPGLSVVGIDVSEYALTHTLPEIEPSLQVGNAVDLSRFADHSFDFVLSLTTLHNLKIYDLMAAVREIERVSKGKSYIVVESWRSEAERVNLLYWQLTCASFYDVSEWEWIYRQCGYTGDYGFIFFD